MIGSNDIGMSGHVAYALGGQLNIPRHTIKMARHRPGVFFAEFSTPAERDRTMLQGSILIGGSSYTIDPWMSAGGATETTWYFHVKVALEFLPRKAWNEDGVWLVLGDSCIFDRIVGGPVAREDSDLLTCWVWMEDPDYLTQAVSYTVFAAKAGQAMVINGLPRPTRHHY